MQCKHQGIINGIGECCFFYSLYKRKDGLHWAHYPVCKGENCPISHPELLVEGEVKA